MHAFGHACDSDPLLSLASDFQLAMVEDAAKSLGSYYSGLDTETFGKLGALSFNGNETITCGVGGAVITNEKFWQKKQSISRRLPS
jgi:dTDP-4-amino-4,6-dideoxygalactose transaminase